MDANTRCAMYHSGLQVAASVEIAKRLSPVDTAAAYTIWNRWIASRGFNPPPGPRSWTVKPLSATSGMVAIDVAKQQRDRKGNRQQRDRKGNRNRATARQATSATATENWQGKQQRDKQRQGPQRRIEKVSAQQKRARVIALALANRNGLP